MTDTVREALEQARALITTYLPQLKDGDTYIKIEAALATASDGWRDISREQERVFDDVEYALTQRGFRQAACVVRAVRNRTKESTE